MSKSPSLKRIQADIRELAQDPSDRYHAAPLEDDMFEWHFTIRGADGTEFEGGVYHGRILLPPEYPFKPPNIVFLTPSGRFETGTKICLSFSAFHPELWQPAWGIRLILEGLISFLPTPGEGALGALDWTKEERKRLAKKSLSYCCPRCGNPSLLLPKVDKTDKESSSIPNKYQKEIEQLHMHQSANNKARNENTANNNPASSNPPHNTTPPERINNSVTQNREQERQQQPSSADQVAISSSSSWVTDPVVHGSIVTFAMIVFLLYRKVETLIYELRSMDD